MSTLYERIETLCQQKRVNITTMCKESGASRGALTDLKAGRKKSLSAETLSKIADYFQVSIDFLVGKENAPQTEVREAEDQEFIQRYLDLTEAQKQALRALVKSYADK